MADRNKSRGGFEIAKAVSELYAQGQTDYYLDPIVLTEADAKPIGRITNGDSVVFCCRRGEREIQLTEAFTDRNCPEMHGRWLNDLYFVILTLYHEKFKDLPVAFAPSRIDATIGQIVSTAGLTQSRIAESEKFAHVTFFFNGGNNKPFVNEDDVRIPSPKGVPFDSVPALSLPAVADEVIKTLRAKKDLVVTNFANGDVIGHTSNDEAKICAAHVVDEYLRLVVQEAINDDYVVMITADHGNLEVLHTESGEPHVSHTSNLVPFMLIDPRASQKIKLRDGILADIAPTILEALSLPQPQAMTGNPLTIDHNYGQSRKVMLIILDGWGNNSDAKNNPIMMAKTPYWDTLLKTFPVTALSASGESVGLKPGKTGNSEAGHMNIGSGRVVLQDDVRLDKAMEDGSFYQNNVINEAISRSITRKKKLHLIGLLTEKSSHGSIDYPLAVLKMAKNAGLREVYLHVIFDGRSTEPGTAPLLLEKLDSMIAEIGIGTIVTGIGRGIALDRDGNYHKTQIAFDALVSGLGKQATYGS